MLREIDLDDAVTAIHRIIAEKDSRIKELEAKIEDLNSQISEIGEPE